MGKDTLSSLAKYCTNQPLQAVHTKRSHDLKTEAKMSAIALKRKSFSVVDEGLLDIMQQSSVIRQHKTDGVTDREMSSSALQMLLNFGNKVELPDVDYEDDE